MAKYEKLLLFEGRYIRIFMYGMLGRGILRRRFGGGFRIHYGRKIFRDVEEMHESIPRKMESNKGKILCWKNNSWYVQMLLSAGDYD
nr:hypothetical protein [Eubacterium sp.]